MQTITAGYRGLGLLVSLNRDLILSIGTILCALALGAFLGTLLI
jgi:hypothetical protein